MPLDRAQWLTIRRLLFGSAEECIEGLKFLVPQDVPAVVAAIASVIEQVDASEPRLPDFAYSWLTEMQAGRFSGVPAALHPAEVDHALRTASWPAGLCLAQLVTVYMGDQRAAVFGLLGAIGVLTEPKQGGSPEATALLMEALEKYLCL